MHCKTNNFSLNRPKNNGRLYLYSCTNNSVVICTAGIIGLVWLLAYLKPKKISESAGSGGRFSKSWAYIRGEDGVGAHPVNLTVVKCEGSNPTGFTVQLAIR